MCGFIQRDTSSPAVLELLEEVGLGQTIPLFKEEAQQREVLNFYPAFGKAVDKRITNLIVDRERTIDATWWYDATPQGETLALGDRTTFNARNLDSPYWHKAISKRRGVIVATALGESNLIANSKSHYLMRPISGAMLLGVVYRVFSNGCFSCAVVTRPPRPDFSQYHEKSIPCFLPNDKEVISAWLGNCDHPVIDELLSTPKIYSDLEVTKVKTFKSGEPLAPSSILHASKN